MKITGFLDYEVILANRSQPVHFALRFEAPHHEQQRARAAAFCIVLDRSGSMEGAPLAKAKQAALLAVRNLRPEDQFSLVMFDDEALVQVPFQPATQKESFARLIQAIEVRGATNLTGGWMLGRDELKKAADGMSRRLLLLSDGLLNRGITDPGAVRQVAVDGLEKQQVRTSCLGFGAKYNEDLMTILAQATGGQFYDADSPEKFPAIFEAELEGLQKITVQNLRVRLRKLDFCDSVQPLGTYPEVQRPDGCVEFSLGDLISDETRVACFGLNVLPLPWLDGKPVVSLEGERLIEIEVLYDEIGETEISSHAFNQLVRIQATQNPGEVRQKTEVIPWVAMQRAGKVMDDVTRLMDAGNPGAAIVAVQRAIDLLKAYGANAPTGEAVQQLEALLRRIQGGEWSLRERKLSKYRSHSYRRMSSSEFWSGGEPPPGFKQPPPPPPIIPPGTQGPQSPPPVA